jgi:hypothetical protein
MWSVSLWRSGSGHEFTIYNSKDEADVAYESARVSAKLLGYGRKIQKTSGLPRLVTAVKQYWEVARELRDIGNTLDELADIQELCRWSVTYNWGRSGHHFASYGTEQEAKSAYKKINPFATKILRQGREVVESYAPFCLFYFWGQSLIQYSQLCLSVMEHQDTLAGSLYTAPAELKSMELKSSNRWLKECTSPASPSSLVSSVESDTVLADSVLGDSIPLVFYY